MRFNYTKTTFPFSFAKNAKRFFWFSIAITLIGIALLSTIGLNYGVDFRAGSSVDLSVSKDLSAQKAEIAAFIKDEGLGEPTITVGAERVTLRFDEILSNTEENALKNGFASKFDSSASAEVNTVDTEMAKELQFNAILAVLVASIAIIIYVSIRFEWRYAVSAVVALMHDAFIVVSLFSIFRFEVTLPFIVAVLTIIGYSINDTIVIFDRVRENMRFAKVKTEEDLDNIVDHSVWQTFTRSINTVVTVLIAALALFLFGSDSIRMFSLAIIFGLVSGAYSSIFIASPLWLVFKKRQLRAQRAAKALAAASTSNG